MAGRDPSFLDRRTLTTGQVARILDCSDRHALGLLRSGAIPSWRLPGPGGVTLTTPRALCDWMRREGVPLSLLGASFRPRVLAVSPDREMVRRLAADLAGRAELFPARTWFEAGAIDAAESPHVLVLDGHAGLSDALSVAASPPRAGVARRSVVLLPEDAGAVPPPADGVEVLARPFDPDALAALVLGGGGGCE